jgi:putative ABC transport system permease protein
MGIPIVVGRGFDGGNADNRQSVVVNSSLADALWPGENPLGQAVQRDGVTRTVIGVVRFERCHGLLGGGGPCFWEPVRFPGTQAWIRIRVRSDDAAFIAVLRTIVRELHPDVALADFAAMDDHISRLTTNQRISAVLSGVLAVIGITLVVIGCFSLFASVVKDSERELAIRQALGAMPHAIVQKVVLRALWIVGTGTLVGIVASVFVRKRVADQLFDVARWDMTAFVVTVPAIVAAALLATYMPVRVALKKDPALGLREA